MDDARAYRIGRLEFFLARRSILSEQKKQADRPLIASVAAGHLVTSLVRDEPPLLPGQESALWRNLLDDVDRSEVEAAVQEMLRVDTQAWLVRLPAAFTPLPSSSEVLRIASAAEPSGMAVKAPRWSLPPTQKPARQSAVNFRRDHPLAVRSLGLDNGVAINARSIAGSGRIQLAIRLGSGPTQASERTLAAAAAAALEHPALSYASITSVRDFLRRKQMTLAGHAQPDGLVISLGAPAGALNEATQLASVLLTGLEIDEGAFVGWKQAQGYQATARALRDQALARLRERVSGASAVAPDDEQLSRLTRDQVQDYLRRLTSAASVEVGLVGDRTIEDLLKAATETLGTLPRRQRPAGESVVSNRAPADVAPIREVIRAASDEKGATVLLAWAVPSADGDAGKRRTMRAVANLLEKQLRAELRERRSLVYQVDSSSVSLRGFAAGSTLYATFSVDPERVDAATRAALGVVETWRRHGPSAAEVQVAARESTADMQRAYQSLARWALRLASLQERADDMAELARSLDGSARVTREDVMLMLRTMPPPTQIVATPVG
jgi:hypothetical protein